MKPAHLNHCVWSLPGLHPENSEAAATGAHQALSKLRHPKKKAQQVGRKAMRVLPATKMPAATVEIQVNEKQARTLVKAQEAATAFPRTSNPPQPEHLKAR